MKKFPEWCSAIETEHKTFNKQSSGISWGNIVAETQYGSYIRPRIETECNGFSNPEGHLRNFDLKYFARMDYFQFIKSDIERRTDKEGGILYVFFHRYHGRKLVHGYILTNKDFQTIFKWVNPYCQKSRSVIDFCEKYVTI